jgi:hypothetical protein
MTREKEIEQHAKSYTLTVFGELDDFSDVTDAYIDGAKWADEHPNLYNNEKYHTVKVSCLDELNRKAVLYDTFLEKACEYLRTHLWQNVDADNDPIVESVHNITLDNFIKDIKRYLED